MEYTIRQIAELLNGNLVGDPNGKITKLSKIEEGEEGSLTFLANPKYERFLYNTKASAVLVNKNLNPTKSTKATLIFVDDSYASFSSLLEEFKKGKDSLKVGKEEPCFIDPSVILGTDYYIGAFSYIGKGCQIGNRVQIYPQVYIGDNVSIGEGTVIFPGVKIYQDCQIGKNIILHSGCIIGSDGFGFALKENGTFSKILQTGNVILEDNVEIGSNTCIDRATIGTTLIRKGVKLDNLIQIAHNVEIGENTVMAAQTGISGSTKIGENCVFGGQVGAVGHITIGKRNQFGAKSGISKTIKEEGMQFRGQPIQTYKESLKTEVLLRNLSKMEQRIREIEKKDEL